MRLLGAAATRIAKVKPLGAATPAKTLEADLRRRVNLQARWLRRTLSILTATMIKMIRVVSINKAVDPSTWLKTQLLVSTLKAVPPALGPLKAVPARVSTLKGVAPTRVSKGVPSALALATLKGVPLDLVM